jgi:hypothetical protein
VQHEVVVVGERHVVELNTPREPAWLNASAFVDGLSHPTERVADTPNPCERLLNRSHGIGESRERSVNEPKICERYQNGSRSDPSAQDQQSADQHHG